MLSILFQTGFELVQLQLLDDHTLGTREHLATMMES